MAARRGRPPVPPPARLEQRPARRVFLGTAAPRLPFNSKRQRGKPAGLLGAELNEARLSRVEPSRYSGPQEISAAAEKVAALATVRQSSHRGLVKDVSLRKRGLLAHRSPAEEQR